MTAPRLLAGTVVAFDEGVGLGEIRADGSGADGTGADGWRRFPFHCTQIADGSRTVAVGTRVSFGLLAGRAGRWEAGEIRPAADD